VRRCAQDADTLRRICENVVIPNLQFREADEELFAENYVEYIRRDMEGSDADTRRRMACELLKALTSKFQKTVTDAVSGYVGTLLAQYAAAPATAWKQKDCAIYLVIALTVRGKTDARGVTALNELVPIGEFFASQIVPELSAPPASGWPVLKADALKFLTTFRSQIPKAQCLELLPSIAALLGVPDNVVHSYAALAVEKLLTVRDGGALRFAAADLVPFREQLLGGLFKALTLPESGENDYVMKALMRVLAVLGPDARPVAQQCMAQLAAIMQALAANPRNPVFCHYLFECVAALVRHAAAEAALAPQLEALLFGPFELVLRNDVTEFAPYVFQLLSQLVELRPPPLPPAYLAIFPPLLSPVLWERAGNVPALVRLLQAYLARAPAEVVAGGHLNGVLGVFQKLNASRHHEHEGFFILNTLVEYLDASAWAQHVPTIWSLLLQRLQHSRTARYTRSFCVFFALLVARLGPAWTASGLDAVQAGLFASLLEHVWLPALGTVSGDVERKVAAVAGTKLLCEYPPLAADGAAALWGRLLEAVLSLLVEAEDDDAAAAAAADDDEAAAGAAHAAGAGHAAYARLVNAARPETDPVATVANPQQHLAASLAALAAAQPGRLGPRIAAALSAASQASLAKLCAEAGVGLV
jgi:exportin-2 (importin alpha re-exporter)